jgi:iron complex outermembrane recepter protein
MKDVMAHTNKTLHFAHAIFFVSVFCIKQSYAQAENVLETVVVKANTPDRVVPSDLISMGDAPLTATPISVTLINSQQIEATGAKRLADLNKVDASVSDAYNAVGYWDYATVRGFVLDNKYNYRREGLPISAESAIGLDNKASVEILKGTSGIQAGVSAPGGLVNYTIKRPPAQGVQQKTIRLETNDHGSYGVAADFGGRLGASKEFGYRFNAAVDRLNSDAVSTQGKRQLLAFAGDWRIHTDSLLQFELEYSNRAQRSVPGLSLLGNSLPSPNPNLNINSQAWSQPVVLKGLTGSVKLDQAINDGWRLMAQMGSQKLTSQDRVAFPFGCFDASTGTYYADRYCPDGSFDLYDFRSENERRSTLAGQLQLNGQLEIGRVKHSVSLGLLNTTSKDRFNSQVNQAVGAGSIYGFIPFAGNSTPNYENTNRNERSNEFSISDVAQWSNNFTTWAGLRYTQLKRSSISTDGSSATAYSSRVASPWFAASYKLAPSAMLYASYGKGLESEVTPNRAVYTNPGQVLPALKSTQYELGLKGQSSQYLWTATAFEITRPQSGNAGAMCDLFTANTCTRVIDGSARHRGLELSASTPPANPQRFWQLSGGLTVLQARRHGSLINSALNGLRPVNVPQWVARLNGDFLVPALPGLALQAHVSHEGKRAVLADNSIQLPSWTRLDLGLRYEQPIASTKVSWTFAIDNALNKRYFKESPTQFNHVYLMTGAARTLRLAMQVNY